MPSPVNFHDRVLLVGKTRSGKSVFARHLMAQMTGARRLLINVKGSETLGVEPVYDPAHIDWSAPLVDFIPRSMERDVFEEVYRGVFEHAGPRVVWLDEAMGPTRANYAPPHLDLLQQQGGGLGLGHFYLSQRPQNIAMSLRSEAEHIFMFGTTFTKRDRDVLGAEMGLSGDQLAERMRQAADELGDYAFLWYDRNQGELTDCRPLPAEWAAGGVLVAG